MVFHSARMVPYGAGKVFHAAVKVSHVARKVSTDYCLLSESCSLQESAVESKKIFFKQLGPGVLRKSNTEKGVQLKDSVAMSTWRQPSNPRLRLGLLGCQLIDIEMKLPLVHFAVKFSSALAAPRSQDILKECLLCLQFL